MSEVKPTSTPLTRDQRTRKAVLLTFCDPVPAQSLQQLSQLSANEWQRLLHWLDTSGLALYFLDRMVDLHLWHTLPHAVFARLKQNLVDNAERTRSLINESFSIQKEFQRAGVSYALLKGFSLYPYSVPRLELRSQLDLDFLVAEKNIPESRAILERLGYRLHAVSGRSWEFKTCHIPNASLGDLYKNVPHRCVELHAEKTVPGQRSLLANACFRDFHGIRMPVLSPADLFLGQGMHVFKHICSESTRIAHLLEFRRHVIARRGDNAFWNEIRPIAETNPRAPFALGVATLLITRIMGEFALEPLLSWTVDRVPVGARLWVARYGQRSALAGFPGTKLYLLLQRELEAKSVTATRPVRRALMPLRLPPAVALPAVNETFHSRVRRYRLQLRFIFLRLRFHVTEGSRYLLESHRWRLYMSQLTRSEASGTPCDAPLISIRNPLSPTTKE